MPKISHSFFSREAGDSRAGYLHPNPGDVSFQLLPWGVQITPEVPVSGSSSHASPLAPSGFALHLSSSVLSFHLPGGCVHYATLSSNFSSYDSSGFHVHALSDLTTKAKCWGQEL